MHFLKCSRIIDSVSVFSPFSLLVTGREVFNLLSVYTFVNKIYVYFVATDVVCTACSFREFINKYVMGIILFLCLVQSSFTLLNAEQAPFITYDSICYLFVHFCQFG